MKKAAGIKEQRSLAVVTAAVERGGRGGGVFAEGKMRSNCDLDSKMARHNRQGLTPCEPPHPPNLSQNNNRGGAELR